jgi:hypothetical protein
MSLCLLHARYDDGRLLFVLKQESPARMLLLLLPKAAKGVLLGMLLLNFQHVVYY